MATSVPLTLSQYGLRVALIWVSIGPICFGQERLDGNRVQHALESAAVALNAGHPEQALEALGPIESIEPDNPWLLFYQGTACLQQGKPYDAMERLDRAADFVMGSEDPNTDLLERIRRLRQIARREVLSFSLTVGLAYDSNVTFLGGDVVSGDFISGEEDGVFDSRISLAFAPIKDELQSLVVGVSASNSLHFRVDSFDAQDYKALIRYSRKLDRHSTLSLLYEYDFVLFDNEAFLSSHAGELAWHFDWLMNPAPLRLTRSVVSYRVEARDFRYPVEAVFDRDGLRHVVGFEQQFQFTPISELPWIWEGRVGYRFEYVETKGQEFDRLAHLLHFGVAFPLLHPVHPEQYLLIPDKELRLELLVNCEIVEYRRKSANDRAGRQRDDLIMTYGAVLSQTLTRRADAGDVTLHLIARWMDADSTLRTTGDVSPFTYDKFVYGLQIEWSW